MAVGNHMTGCGSFHPTHKPKKSKEEHYIIAKFSIPILTGKLSPPEEKEDN